MEQVWVPLVPREAYELFGESALDWCIGGGWALELFAGVRVREHGDLDIVLFRDELLLLPSAPYVLSSRWLSPPGRSQAA